MNKSELIRALAEKKKLSPDESAKFVAAFVESLKEALLRGGRVEIRGFCTLMIRSYRAYVGRNPRTGDAVKVQPKRLPYFRPSKEFRDYINAPE